MEIVIRKEEIKDYTEVNAVIKKAFAHEKMSGLDEQELVIKLRKSNSYIPQLALVALYFGEIVGYILLSEIKIANQHDTQVSLAMAPVCVLPKYQNKSIGTMLIIESHLQAKSLAYQSIVLLGHEKYYSRFGYKKASEFEIVLPSDGSEKNCMVLELAKDTLKGHNGEVVYPKEFF